MDELVNTRGRGSLGTATNTPVGDGNTMARTQNRPAATNGVTADSGIPGMSAAATGVKASGLTERDRQFIREIHSDKHLDGSPYSLYDLQVMRSENVLYLEQAMRAFGPNSSTVEYFREVIAAYDERIEEAKSPMGSAINGLKTVLVDSSATENDRREKIRVAFGVMRQEQLSGVEDPQSGEAVNLICKIVKQDAKEKNDALKALVDKEKRFSGSVSEDDFKTAIAKVMGNARQQQLMGIDDDDTDASGGLAPVVEVVNLVADRRVASLKDLLAKEKRSPGSVSDQQFSKVVQAVLGDERQKELMGINRFVGNGIEPVIDVFKVTLQRRRDAISELFRRQAIPGGGVTNAQINQALADYETAKQQALRIGLAVPNAPDMPDQDPKVESGAGE